LPVGTLWHELIGHGLVGIAAGGHLGSITVLGVDLWPPIQWSGLNGYGACEIDVPTRNGELLMQLGGSMSTLLASMAALLLLHLRRWRSAWARAALLAVGVWWIDILTYTLPTWGLRRSIFWGGRYAEPYEAAVALGIPGPLFQAVVILGSLVLAGLWLSALLRRDDLQAQPRRPV
jgi:hypothetical protein